METSRRGGGGGGAETTCTYIQRHETVMLFADSYDTDLIIPYLTNGDLLKIKLNKFLYLFEIFFCTGCIMSRGCPQNFFCS